MPGSFSADLGVDGEALLRWSRRRSLLDVFRTIQDVLEGPQVSGIVLPAAHGAFVNRLPDLHQATGADGPFTSIKIKTTLVPAQPTKRYQPSTHRLRFVHQLLVPDLEQRERQHRTPVCQ